MEYISSRKIVHNDLAARNCLVCKNDRNESKYLIKIGDFGLSHILSESSYYYKESATLPARWCAPEVLRNGVSKFSTYSDVWSFGVTLWEIWTVGQFEPYWQLDSNSAVKQYVVEGKTLKIPETVPSNFANLMTKCWQQKPSLRPNFETLCKEIENLTT
jgi:Janus kinase 2